jgi:hypothetical protein
VASSKQIAAWVFGAAVLGLSVFALLAWQSVTVQRVAASAAVQQFEAIRASMKGSPLVRRDDSGHFERRATAPNDAPVSQLHVLAYHVSGQQLVRADVAFWLFTAKGPAVQYALRGTDFDLAALNLTPGELQAAGSCVVLDEVRLNGDEF